MVHTVGCIYRRYFYFCSLKQKFPKAFQDLCFYSEVSYLLATCSFRLTARRFIQELFEDLDLSKVGFQITLKLSQTCLHLMQCLIITSHKNLFGDIFLSGNQWILLYLSMTISWCRISLKLYLLFEYSSITSETQKYTEQNAFCVL